MPEPILSCNFRFRRNDFKLDFRADFDNQFTALFGPSGCGKTTTLRNLAGLLQPEHGEICFRNQIVFSSRAKVNVPLRERNIGLVFQDSRLFPHLSVIENLKFGASFSKSPQKIAFKDIVDLLGLADFLDRNPLSLSGGERQRVALGRALLATPNMLLMDEPLAAIDQPTKYALLAELKKIHHEFDLPVIYVSHDLASVLNIAHRVVLMKNGKVISHGEPFEIFQDQFYEPSSQDAHLQNIFEAIVKERSAEHGTVTVSVLGLELILPSQEVAVGQKILLDVPASEILLALEEPVGLSARNILPGTIEQVFHIGERYFVKVKTGELSWSVEVVERTVAMLSLKPGLRVFLIIKATGLRVIK